jgi:hypothetical protein
VVEALIVIVPPVKAWIRKVRGVKVVEAVTVTGCLPGKRVGGLEVVFAAGEMVRVPDAQLTFT